MSMRNTGMNKLKANGKLETNGRNSDGNKTKVVTNRKDDRTDTYWGGEKKTDGTGHGHTWDNRRDGEKGSRKPR
jgi:hypothetical protein